MLERSKAPLLVLIVGLPCTGKTTIARCLARDLPMTLIGKDEIKELLFDSLGLQDREWSKRLGGAAFEVLYWSIGKLLSAGRSLIVDVDFSNPEIAAERLTALNRLHPFRPVIINFVADGSVLFERFQKRALSGERHPGHVDHMNFDEFKPTLLKGGRQTVGIPAEQIEVDMTNFEVVPYGQILALIQEHMHLP